MQTRKQSATEVIVKTCVGFCVAWVMTMYLLPMWDNPGDPQSAFEITCMYTVNSMIITYSIRRWFNGRLVNSIQTMDDKTVLEMMKGKR